MNRKALVRLAAALALAAAAPYSAGTVSTVPRYIVPSPINSRACVSASIPTMIVSAADFPAASSACIAPYAPASLMLTTTLISGCSCSALSIELSPFSVVPPR